MSFSIYMKEHDVLTGIRRVTMDERKLRDEEDAYVKRMRAAVGERKKLLSPESLLPKQTRVAAAPTECAPASRSGVASTGSA